MIYNIFILFTIMAESPRWDIPEWATQQIRSGLKLDKNTDIRTALDALNLDYVTDFFKWEKDIPKNTAKTAYAIAMYQKALSLLGYSPIVVDGLYKMKNPKSESETKKMIRKFQVAVSLTEDGIPGPDTATKIYEALQKLQKPNTPKLDTPIWKKIIKPVEKIEKELPPTSALEWSYFQFANSKPIPETPLPTIVQVPEVITTVEESNFWDDMVSGFKSRFVSKK